MEKASQPETNDEEEVIDDWGLATTMDSTGSSAFHLFAQHELHLVQIPLSSQPNKPNLELTTKCYGDNDDEGEFNVVASGESSTHLDFHLYCIESSLTPIDMTMSHSNNHDTTGHCVWTGSFLFIEALMQLGLYSDYFANDRNILELGCGTGISGIALLKIIQYEQALHLQSFQQEQLQQLQTISLPSTPSLVVLTDSDPEALTLSYKNFQANFSSIRESTNDKLTSILNEEEDEYQEQMRYRTTLHCEVIISSLEWGKETSTKFMQRLIQQRNNEEIDTIEDSLHIVCNNMSFNTYPEPSLVSNFSSSFDTIFATDVLYDIGKLAVLLETAQVCLSRPPAGAISGTDCNDRDKFFVLSHVPRACYNSQYNPPPSHPGGMNKALEELIVCTAHLHHFQLTRTIRPLDVISLVIAPQNRLKRVLNDVTSLLEMHEIGAVIFIFQYLPETIVDSRNHVIDT